MGLADGRLLLYRIEALSCRRRTARPSCARRERLASSPIYRRDSKPASLIEAVVRPEAGPAHPASHPRGEAAEVDAASGEPRLSAAAQG